MSYEMNDLLDLMVDQGASDLHLQVGQPPTIRLSGSMTPIDGPALTPSDTEKLMQSITPDAHISKVKLEGGAEFAHVNIMAVAHGTDKALVLAHKAAIDEHLAAIGMPVSYTNVFWGGRSEIKPSEISPRAYREWLARYRG